MMLFRLARTQTLHAIHHSFKVYQRGIPLSTETQLPFVRQRSFLGSAGKVRIQGLALYYTITNTH